MAVNGEETEIALEPKVEQPKGTLLSSKRKSPVEPSRAEDAIPIAMQLCAQMKAEDQVILFTSIDQQDGTAYLSYQCALGLTLVKKASVVLVDCNFDLPSLHEDFQIEQSPGVFDVIQRTLPLEQTLFETNVAELRLLPVGNVPGEDLAHTLKMFDRLVEELKSQFQYIFIQTFPILEHSEIAMMVSQSDGVVLAAAEGKHRRSQMVEIKRQLDSLQIPLMGIVLTKRTKKRRKWLW